MMFLVIFLQKCRKTRTISQAAGERWSGQNSPNTKMDLLKNSKMAYKLSNTTDVVIRHINYKITYSISKKHLVTMQLHCHYFVK